MNTRQRLGLIILLIQLTLTVLHNTEIAAGLRDDYTTWETAERVGLFLIGVLLFAIPELKGKIEKVEL